MIDTIVVALGDRKYPIYVGADVLGELGPRVADVAGRVAVISNADIWNVYGPAVSESLADAQVESLLIEVPDGEQAKSLGQAETVYDRLMEGDITRGCAIVALGGGVIGDLSGFVAATYMRGLPYVQIPTTLLAQVDSSVGGKVAVNHPKCKNLIGAFYQPKFVLADVATLESLPERQLGAGMAEVIKCAWLAGEDFLGYLEDAVERALALDRRVLARLVSVCCRFKARIVEEDELDRGRRAVLNYGHTIGHGIESLTGYESYHHGEAVGIGMVGAAKVAKEMGLVDQAVVERHIRLLERAKLPTRLPQLKIDDLIKLMMHDKKRQDGSIRMVLLDGVGNPRVSTVSEEVLSKALAGLIGE